MAQFTLAVIYSAFLFFLGVTWISGFNPCNNATHIRCTKNSSCCSNVCYTSGACKIAGPPE